MEHFQTCFVENILLFPLVKGITIIFGCTETRFPIMTLLWHFLTSSLVTCEKYNMTPNVRTKNTATDEIFYIVYMK